MKKFITIVLLCMLGSGVYAQSISGGVKAGLNLANQIHSGNGSANSPDFLPSLHAGGYVTLMFTDHVGFQPELLYSGQGFKSSGYKYKLGYVAIPLLVRFNVNDLLSFHAGPQVSLLTSAKADKTDVKDQVKGTDVGVAFGGTVDLPIKLNFTLRAIVGVTDINDTNSAYKQKNFTVQLSVGYRLFGK
jgi:hypothetical protein